MGRTDGRVCCFRITAFCKLSRHSRFQSGICFNYPDRARSCATLLSLNLPLIEWGNQMGSAAERRASGWMCPRCFLAFFHCGWDKSITDKLVNVDPVKKKYEFFFFFFQRAMLTPYNHFMVTQWSVFSRVQSTSFFFSFSFPFQNWLQRKKNKK